MFIKLKPLFFITLTYILFVSAAFAEAPEITRFVDKDSAGWAYKLNDIAFLYRSSDCIIQWNAIQNLEHELSLSLYQKCDKPFSLQLPIHRKILDKINHEYPLRNFTNLSWGRFCKESDYSWCAKIALASLKSDEYADYRKNYPNSKIKNINRLFVFLAEQSNAYEPLKRLFEEYSLNISLSQVEKVFVYKLEQQPFSSMDQFSAFDPGQRVIGNTGSSFFSINPM